MRLAIFGSRSLKDERVRILILEEIERHNPDTIVTSAEPDGVCGLARAIAKEKAIPLKLHFLNFAYLRGAFEHRSKDVINDCDHMLLIHDGVSKGTANEYALTQKKGRQHTYVKLKPAEYENSVGFEITEDWQFDLEY